MPATRPTIVEYRSTEGRDNPSATTVLYSAVGNIHGYPTVSLTHSTEGYEPAGSMLRWTNEYWAVRHTAPDGARHGKRYLTLTEALVHYSTLTNPAAVAARRTADAERHAAQEATCAAAACVADGYTIEAAKRYRSAWQWRVNYPGMGNAWCGYAKTKTAALAEGRAALIHRIISDQEA